MRCFTYIGLVGDKRLWRINFNSQEWYVITEANTAEVWCTVKLCDSEGNVLSDELLPGSSQSHINHKQAMLDYDNWLNNQP